MASLLIIENHKEERERIIHQFSKHKLNPDFQFVNSYIEALHALSYFEINSEREIQLPEIILTTYHEGIDSMLNAIRYHPRFKRIRLFILVNKNPEQLKARFNSNSIVSIVDSTLDFKNVTSFSYLENIDLYLHLVKISMKS